MATGQIEKIVGESRKSAGPDTRVDGGSVRRLYFAIDCAGHLQVGEARGCERDAKPGSDEADDCRPLGRVLNDVGSEAAALAAGDRAIEGERAHLACEQHEGFCGKILHA